MKSVKKIFIVVMSASVLLLGNSIFAKDDEPKVETKKEKVSVSSKEVDNLEDKKNREKIKTKKIEKKVKKKKKRRKKCPKSTGSRLSSKRC
jgi:hypothetical protein